ncbi:replication factor A protein 2 [Gamsiella multidivaricata]|nr:replication factor A protein 2 [Gamsiella multidivaricata]
MSTNRPYSNAGLGQGIVQDSFSSDAGATKKIINHALRPVTIKQLITATQTQADGDFKIDGHDLGQITFIAVVRSINRQSTQDTYSVEDGTGAIDVKRFRAEDEDPAELNSVVEGTYVRIFGLLRQFNQRFSINSHTIRPIQDMNEITYHNLEVIYAHISSTRHKVGHSGIDTSMMSSSSHNYGSHGIAGAGGMGAGSSGGDVAQQITEMITTQTHSTGDNKGVHRREIIARFAPIAGGAEAVK